MKSRLSDRAAGCLAGVAVGDALGMPMEFLTRRAIAGRYGRIDRYYGSPPGHIHAGTPAGRVTDDTEQTWALARALIREGRLTPSIAGAAYLQWAEESRAWEKSWLGPSTRQALLRVKNGEDPAGTGRGGSTVGAAMRVAPVGIVNAGRIDDAVEEAYLSAIPTHGANIAIAGACAIAAGVAQALVTDSVMAVAEAVIHGAEAGERRGEIWAGPTVPGRLRLALDIVRRLAPKEAEDALYDVVGVGMSPTELVPCALGLVVLYDGHAGQAIPAAAGMGGDADTLAAMVGALCGALRGLGSLPPDWVETVERLNGIDCRDMAQKLVEVWDRRRSTCKGVE